jgi:poly-gamma-glutamate capsule biosynthesis protein CapA/YwtB (metallophosphatase superfamily)
VVSRRVRRRRRQVSFGGLIFLVLIIYLATSGGGGGKSPTTTTTLPPSHAHTALAFPAHSPLNPKWKGNGKTVTMAFGGDVHFAGAVGTRLAQNPSTALGTTVSQLLGGADLRMVNLETAVTNAAACPQRQSKPYIFVAPATAITALKDASVTVAAEANDHAVDCGTTGLTQNLAIASAANFPLVGVGHNDTEAFAPYRVTINGQRIAVIAATQVIASNLVSTWTATSSQPGVASALDPTELVHAVQQARRTSDTVVVYLHWGTEVQTCPNTQQEPLAQQLVNAGADIVIGSNAHVLLGGGYLGSAYIDYGLGNFAFYDNTAPETSSGVLVLTAVGRQITSATWRPATILAGLPQPLSGAPATTALQSWEAARSCTNLAASPAVSQATEAGETQTFTAPPTTTTISAPSTSGGSTSSTTTVPGSAGLATTTTAHGATTTTTTRASTTTTGPNSGG